MKPGLSEIVGRTISRIVVAHMPHGPGTQVLLEFEDGMSFELYGTQFTCGSGVMPLAHSVSRRVEAQRPETITAVYARIAQPTLG